MTAVYRKIRIQGADRQPGNLGQPDQTGIGERHRQISVATHQSSHRACFVSEAIAEIAEPGVGGIIATFRLGPLPHEAAIDSLRLFMSEVAPRFCSLPVDGPVISAA